MDGNTDFNLYKELIDEKFKGITTLVNAQFSNVADKLDSIHKEAQKTNSRVTHLEEEVDDLDKKVDEAITYGNHVIDTRAVNCPNVERIKNVEDEVRSVSTWKTTEMGIRREGGRIFDNRVKTWSAAIATLLLLTSIYFGAKRYSSDMSSVKGELKMQGEIMIETFGADYMKGRTRGGILIDSLNTDTIQDGEN